MPIVTVSFDPLSADIVRAVETSANDKLPEPSVVKNCPFVTVQGRV